jgi:hypothetical protein
MECRLLLLVLMMMAIHYRSRLGKASKALGKAFAERSSRQSALGENPIDKGFFAESRLLVFAEIRSAKARQSAK